MDKFIGYIYKITNVDTNKFYIGQTKKSINERYKQHITNAFDKHSSMYTTHFYASIRKYGINSFYASELIRVVAYSKVNLLILLDAYEQFYIFKLKTTDSKIGYNCNPGGQYRNYLKSDIEQSLKNKIKYESCCVEGCFSKHLAKGYCIKHYTLFVKFGKIKERTVRTPNEIIVHDSFASVLLYDKNNDVNALVLIDIEDIDLIKNYKWHLKSCARGKYAAAYDKISHKQVKLHSLILLCDGPQVIVHINGDGLDNRKKNLKIESHTDKLRNLKIQSSNKSGYKGVYFDTNRLKWVALITLNNKTKSLGRFYSKTEAVMARKLAEEIYYI